MFNTLIQLNNTIDSPDSFTIVISKQKKNILISYETQREMVSPHMLTAALC